MKRNRLPAINFLIDEYFKDIYQVEREKKNLMENRTRMLHMIRFWLDAREFDIYLWQEGGEWNEYTPNKNRRKVAFFSVLNELRNDIREEGKWW